MGWPSARSRRRRPAPRYRCPSSITKNAFCPNSRAIRAALPAGMFQTAKPRSYQLESGETGRPLPGKPPESVVGARKLAVHRARRIGVVAEVDGKQRALSERRAPVERPQGRLERLDNVAGAANRRWFLSPERAGRDIRDPGNERRVAPEAGD